LVNCYQPPIGWNEIVSARIAYVAHLRPLR
jgi:hypothetical protein